MNEALRRSTRMIGSSVNEEGKARYIVIVSEWQR
jgi:hypothetical protein